jgi:tetratricopeptide (TPR) repeat protein
MAGDRLNEGLMDRMDRLKRGLAALAAAVLLIFISTVAVRNWWGERLLTRAQSEQKRGNINGASELYLQAEGYGRDEAAVALARLAYYRRRWEDVRLHARRAIELNPLRGYPHVLLAYARAAERSALQVEGMEQVMDECRRAVALEPSSAGLWKSCADLALRLSLAAGREDGGLLLEEYRGEMAEDYRQAIRHDSRQAVVIAAALARSHPDGTFVLDVIGDEDLQPLAAAVGALFEEGKWGEVAGDYWERASHSSSPGPYYHAAAQSLQRLRRHEEAFAVRSRYLALVPDDAEAHYRAAETGSALGKEAWKETRRLYLRALELDPDNGDYRRRYGVRLFGVGEPGEAQSQLERVVEKDPGDAEAYFALGRILEKAQEKEIALAHYRKALSLRPQHRAYQKAVEALR